MNISNVLPFPLIGWITTLTIIVIAATYLFSKVRQNDMKVLRDANDDLRKSINDGQKKITGLEQAVNTLEHKVEDLEKKNKNFEDLIITALKQYFLENPAIANQIKDIIQPKQ